MVGTLCCCQLPSTPSWRSASCAVPCGFFKGRGMAGVGLGEKRGARSGPGGRSPERQGRAPGQIILSSYHGPGQPWHFACSSSQNTHSLLRASSTYCPCRTDEDEASQRLEPDHVPPKPVSLPTMGVGWGCEEREQESPGNRSLAGFGRVETIIVLGSTF